MEQSGSIKNFLYRHIYLPIIAAWLLTFSFVINNYWSANSSVSTVQSKVSSYVHQQEKDAQAFLADSAHRRQLSTHQFDDKLLNELSQKNFYLFLYANSDSSSESLQFWSTQNVIPLPFMLYGKDQEGFVKMDNGYYVWKKNKLNNYKAIVMIPVKWDYFIENEYLQNNFIIDQSLSYNYDLTQNLASEGLVLSTSGRPLFTVIEKRQSLFEKSNPVAVSFQLIALLLLLFYAHLLAAYVSSRRSALKGILFLAAIIIGLRALTYFFNFPFHWQQFILFNSDVFNWGIFARSLGDLFVNVFLLLWMILFIRSQFILHKFRITPKQEWGRWMVIVFFGFMILALTQFCSHILEAMADSSISFDVVNFFSLNQYSVLAIAVLCLLSIGFFVCCQMMVTVIKEGMPGLFYPFLVVVAVEALLLLSFRLGNINGGYELSVLIWLLLFLWMCSWPQLRIHDNSNLASRMVFWLVYFSFSITLMIKVENDRKEIDVRKNYAEALALKSDPANEILVNSMLTSFTSDFLTANYSRFNNQASSSALKDSIISSNTSAYTNKYDTHIYTFSNNQQPLFNEDSVSFDQLNAVWVSQSKPTSIVGLYYFDQSFDVFSYISKKDVLDTLGFPTGVVFILATPKKQRRDALYPELFSKGKSSSIENSASYAFALYNSYKLVNIHNDYPFPTSLSAADIKSLRFKVVNRKNYDELWYNAGAGNLVVIVKESKVIIETITLFSYFFFCYLLITAILWLINTIVHSRLNRKRIIAYWQLSLRNQIHGAIILISVISFVVIALASVMFFIFRYESNNREKLNRTIRIMEKEVKSTITSGWSLTDSTQLNTLDYDQRLEDAVQKISDIHGVDVNLYDLEGNLRVSSLPLPYNKGILSTKMNPLAYYHLNHNKEIQFFQKESIGNLTYISNYIPVIDANGNVYAYINIPYFTSQNILKQEISNFLITIINLNAFIFLLAGIISLFITNRISSTFSLIAEKMKKINIGSQNDPIKWERNDEIGALVKEYNKMVLKLEESAAVLARTEREGAWREMARQVAHEIKNPLTPMKLSMQFLQKSIDNRSQHIDELARNVSVTLIEQIDHLSNIANAFSQFASIGEPKKELFDINETIRNILLMHETNEQLQIVRQLLPQHIHVFADKTQLHRLFTNLLINAIQAVPPNRMPKIIISQQISDGFLYTSIRDNGTGIDDEVKEKIFTPNFTTKTSGTGLGLAMCKRIAEQSDGDISFETVINEGTTFVVKLPVVKSAS